MLICSDNLNYIKTLKNDSIELIYFDPPFAITEAKYDVGLNWKELWVEMWRVLKPLGTIAIHSSQPFTIDLIATQRKHFKYYWYWDKTAVTGHLFSKKQPMRKIEEICIFYKGPGRNNYYPRTTPKLKPQIKKTCPSHYFIRQKPNKVYITTVNYPNHYLEFKRRQHKYSTRPLELCQYIIESYSLEGDTILDLTCSDAQSGIVCQKINRIYIGIDHSEDMIKDAIENNK